jgi:hypothetical protein
MRLLDLDDDCLSRVAAHSRGHAAFTTLVCKRLLRFTQQAFYPHPVTCNLGTVLQCQATYDVYKNTNEVKKWFESPGARAFIDASLHHGNEDFLMHIFPDWTKRVDALLAAGRIDILEKVMGIPGKPETTKSLIYRQGRELRSSLLQTLEFLGREYGDCGCLFREKNAGEMNTARRYLSHACMAPSPVSLKFLFDWVNQLAPEENSYINALLGIGSLLPENLVRVAVCNGGSGNLAYIHEQMARANTNSGAAGMLFPWICSIFVRWCQKIGYAAWEYMSRVDWKAQGFTLRKAVQYYNEHGPSLLQRRHKPVEIKSEMFRIRDRRSFDIVKAALESKDGWLVDAFQEACVHVPCLEYTCLFQNTELDEPAPINISIMCKCIKSIALSYLLFDDASSCFVTASMFKLSRMDNSREPSAVMKITHYSCLLISELWEEAIADGRASVLKRLHNVIIRNNFLFHTLVLAFKWKQLVTINRFLTRTPQAGISLAVRQRDYLVQHGSVYYPPARLAHTVAKLLAVSLSIARERCREATPPAGKRILPDFRYNPHRSC